MTIVAIYLQDSCGDDEKLAPELDLVEYIQETPPTILVADTPERPMPYRKAPWKVSWVFSSSEDEEEKEQVNENKKM